MRWTWMVVLALAAGCGGIELDQLVKQPAVRSRVSAEPPGDHCPHGGSALQRGLDLDANGVLDDAEVTSTEYSCTTPVPGLLVRISTVLPGDVCPQGGQLSHAGQDTDGDGLLDAEEVTREVYGCNGTEPVLARLSVRPFRPFEGCGTDGTTVKAGVDLDRNGELEDDEVRGEAGACININQAVLVQRLEPAGAACLNGGTLVGLGRDVDLDGAVEEQELLARVSICQATLTFDGDYVVDDAADLEALRGISRIRGKLSIEGEFITEVVLPGLVMVERGLRIHTTEALTRVELANLRFVGEELSLSHNPRLTTLAVGTSPEQEVWVGGNLEIIANPRLQTLQGLASVSPHRGFSLSGNEALQEPGALVNIRDLTGTVTISSNARLRSLPVPNLRTVGESLLLTDNPSLVAQDGLLLLHSVGSHVYIQRNAALTRLEGIQLHRVGGTLSIEQNEKLETLGELGLRQAGSISITGNSALQRVGPLSLLELVEDEFAVRGNPQLVSVEGLPLLRYAKRLVLGNNPSLKHLTGFERLLWLKRLDVWENATLESLADLKALRELESLAVQRCPELTALGLDELARVTSGFVVTDNPKLPACLASSLADVVHPGGEGRVIERNDEGATCGR